MRFIERVEKNRVEKLPEEIEILGDGIGESCANPNPPIEEILGDDIGEKGY